MPRIRKAFGTLEKTVEAFKEGYKEGYSNHRTISFDNRALYSWGMNFPMAVRMPAENNKINGKPWVLLNGDQHSASTSNHLSMTYYHFPDEPRVSISAIREAGLNNGWNLPSLKVLLIDYNKDYHTTSCKGGDHHKKYPNEVPFDDFEKKVPWGSEITYYKEKGKIVTKYAHRIGSVLLEFKNKHYLCSLDESSYFVSLLSRKAKNIKEAFKTLKPDLIHKLERKKIEIQRQGEWFFFKFDSESWRIIPIYLAKILSKMTLKRQDYAKFITLPKKDTRGNDHILTRGIMINKYVVGFGLLRHGRCTSPRETQRYTTDETTKKIVLETFLTKGEIFSFGQHPILRLGNDNLWIGVINTSKADWSAEGGVD